MAETKRTGRGNSKGSTQGNTEAPELTIEESLEQLEQLLLKLESQESSLEESFGYYEQGMKLVKTCQEKIDRVEKQIQVLEEEEDGSI